MTAKTPNPRKRNSPKSDPNFLGEDIQERLGPLLLGFNAAHIELLEAHGPGSIYLTDEPGIYEITICGPMSVSTLTAAVVSYDEVDRLDPIDFRTTYRLPFLPVFSYDRECKDAYVNRMMTSWLERSFLVHEAAILDGIRALPQTQGTVDA